MFRSRFMPLILPVALFAVAIVAGAVLLHDQVSRVPGGAPLTWFGLTQHELRQRADEFAEHKAMEFQAFVATSPALWTLTTLRWAGTAASA